jgi:P27 family predicted phage terminase small subunit
MRGRKQIPTHLKLIRGAEERYINRSEPKIAKGIGECPAYLDDEARRQWFVVTAQLEACGMLTQVDAPSLAVYCQSISRWAAAEADIRERGIIVDGDRNPAVNIAKDAWIIIQKFGSEFGLTPASRARLKLTPDEKKQDAFEEFNKQA